MTNPSKPVGIPKRKIPSDIVEWITGREGLVEYRFLSLAQRCHRIYAKFGLVIGPHGLTMMYKRAGIDYTWSRPQVHKIVDDPTTIPVRRQAALDLKHLLASKEPVIFIDETSIRVSVACNRLWTVIPSALADGARPRRTQ